MGALKSYNETRANLREMKDKMHFFSSFALPCPARTNYLLYVALKVVFPYLIIL